MNSLNNREWELYNFQNIGGSTEYDNLLINKDIDNYFNDIINKPIQQTSNITTIKSNYNLNKFYYDYIEHNLIFIVVLVGIIIFLIIRHYVKDFDNISNSDENSNNNFNNIKQNDIIISSNKNKSKKIQLEKIKLNNYKKELDNEKQKILSIIDELSNMNDYETNLNTNQKYLNTNQKYLNQDINTLYSNNYNKNNQSNQLNQSNQFIYDNDSNYYDINKKQNDKINEIDGLYIEPPFM
jgi:hypothetical protein